MLHAVIIAGGQGTRLWPASRKSYPKQLKPFAGGESLLQRTYERIAPMVPHERIWVETNSDYAEEFLAQVPQLTSDRLILEPQGKNTAAAVGLATAILHKLDPDAVVVNLWSDHYYDDEEGYLAMLKLAVKAVEKFPEHLMSVQATPTYPATNFGYLEAGERLTEMDGIDIYVCKRFVEKPDKETAARYLASGNFYWNAASFIWRADTLLALYKEHMPQMYAGLMRLAAAWDTPDWQKALDDEFAKFESIAIDYAIFEKTSQIAIIPARVGWKDVGSWSVVHEVLAGVEGNNLVSRGKVITLDAENSLIFSENDSKLVAVVGVDDLVVVDTQDALLVMRKSQDQEIKRLINQIREIGEESHL